MHSPDGSPDPERLEIVVNGNVVRAAETSERSAALEFDLPVRESTWIAARSARAHTTPVYVTVNGARHWNCPKAGASCGNRTKFSSAMPPPFATPSTLPANTTANYRANCGGSSYRPRSTSLASR